MSTKKTDLMRDRITAAAIEVLRSEGMPALTQPRVADAAAMRQSHLTYYFPTRSALVEAVAESVAEGLKARFDSAAAADRGTLDSALAGIASPEQTRLLLALVLASDREPSVRRLFRDLVRTIRASIARGLQDHGIDAAPDAVGALHALCVGSAVLDLGRGDSAGEEVERLIGFALKKLGTSGGESA